ncbi:amidase signature domain-containing protein [Xylaria cf. heliscus]|nr:amidase signature domain-containing protein [Xylaria cf. heliscus]
MAKSKPHTVTFVELGNISYYIRARTEASISLPQDEHSPFEISTLLVIHSESNNVSLDLVQDSIARFNNEDDVFNEEFATKGYILIQLAHKWPPSPGPHDGEASGGSLTLLSDYPSPDGLTSLLQERSLRLLVTDGPFTIPEGPYFLKGQAIHQAWRLFPDYLAAFTAAVIPDDQATEPNTFTTLRGSSSWAEGGQIALPSKLYSLSSNLPLAGMRISVKDNMHLKGVVTTLGNRAYAELYGKQDASAQYLDKLVKQGAIIVGKTKLSAFAGSEIPPSQCIDYFPPWNPRGDGYQGPSGSSSGAGASVAGYDWLDISICTDTSGSMRHPATSHGLWASKITWGGVPMDGVVPACEFYDSIGILGRSPGTIERLLQVSNIGAKKESEEKASKTFTQILYPIDWYPLENQDQQRLNEEFLRDLERFTGVQHTKFSLSEEWSRTCPDEYRGVSLKDFLATTSEQINRYDNVHNFDEFRNEYQRRFQKPAYVSPAHTQRWDNARKVTLEQREQAMKQAIIFRKWAADTLFGNDSSVVMIIPQGRPGANYRDITNNIGGFGIPGGPSGPILVATVLGVPQVVIPIGQNAYQSRVSGREEMAPQFTTLIGAFNTDLDLLRLAERTLSSSGKPTELLTGRYAFPQHEHTAKAAQNPGEVMAAL